VKFECEKIRERERERERESPPCNNKKEKGQMKKKQ
jgi:hypothetical protein